MAGFRVLGSLELETERPEVAPAGLPQPKRLALLLYLALAEPRGLHSRDRLLGLLWPDADDESARHSLRNALHALRKTLGDDAIVMRGHTQVGLDFNLVRCDALDLRAHLVAGRREEALALWQGEVAPGLYVSGAPDFEHWLDEQRLAFRGAVRAAAWHQADALRNTGHAELDAVRRAVRLDPGNEPGVRRLMRLLADAGDRAGTLRAYQDLVDHFARELEAEPSSETRALAARLRASGSHTMPASPAPASSLPPFPGPDGAASGRPAPHRRWYVQAAFAAGLLAVLALGGRPLFSRRLPPMPVTELESAVFRLPARYRADTSLFSSYLRGLGLRFEFRFAASRDTLSALVERAPLYVPGLHGLAHAWALLALNDQTNADEAWPKVDVLARRAIALDSGAASAWLMLASRDMFEEHELARARERLDHARVLDSLDPDAAAMLSVWYRFHGQMDSAVASARRAHELDPLSSFFARLLGKQLYFARRYEESRAVYEGLLHDQPGWTRGYVDIAELYRAMGRPRDAVMWLGRTRTAAGDSAGAALLHPAASDPAALRLLRADAMRRIARLEGQSRAGEKIPPSHIAAEYAVLGNTDATFRWLDSMLPYRDSYMHQVRVDPRFDFLRGDPRYADWVSRSGLPPLAGSGSRIPFAK